MNGLPVTPIEVISSSASAASIAVLSEIRPRGPKVFGLVWSSPLSRVIRPITPALPSRGRVTLRSLASVTRSASEEISWARVEQVRRCQPCQAASPFQFGFSQMTVPPMPMPMHMVVSP